MGFHHVKFCWRCLKINCLIKPAASAADAVIKMQERDQPPVARVEPSPAFPCILVIGERVGLQASRMKLGTTIARLSEFVLADAFLIFPLTKIWHSMSCCCWCKANGVCNPCSTKGDADEQSEHHIASVRLQN